MIKDYIVGIGLDVLKDKVQEGISQNEIKHKLDDFIERQSKYNFSCTAEEEIDFEGLCSYIRNNLLEDVKLRLTGNRKERGAARTCIISKAVAYSQAQTSLSRKRAIKLTEMAIDILYSFYKRKVNVGLKLIAAQIEDTIVDSTSEMLTEQTKQLETSILSSEERTVKKISDKFEKHSILSVENNMLLIREGMIEQVERNISSWFDAVGSTHKLFPHYCYAIKEDTYNLYSKPISNEAFQKYPPKISCTGTIQINGKYLQKFDYNTIEYANRHQFPITLNIETAKKYLGQELDPIQRDAEELAGSSLVISPKPFPPAFPCSISLNNDVAYDYILFRTQEILDDDSIVISNYEQENSPFRIKMIVNPKTHHTTYSVKTDNPTNKDLLNYLNFIKAAISGATIAIKVLSMGEILAKGKLENLTYKSGFDSIDDEIDFLKKIVAIEEYYNESINVPEEILVDDFRTISYLATLIQGGECTGGWEKLEFSLTLTEDLKKKLLESDNSLFSLSYVGSITVTIYDKTYELSATRIFDCVKYQDIEKLKQKATVLDIGDEIKLSFLPGEDGSGKWKDVLETKSMDD